jgi:hypothetical protein
MLEVRVDLFRKASVEYAITLHEKILAESTPLQMMAAARKVKRVVSVEELEASAMRRAA